jgi:endonuclease/exonuclease/phosphatase (EEP) superfamily protein YafD
MPPISAAAAALRDAHLEAVWQWTRDRATPWVICGDVNATPWSQPVRGHRPVVEGTWWTGGTWPSWVPSWAAIPIDHVWVSEELQIRSRAVGPHLGSDHRPVMVAIGDRDAP